MSYFDRRPGFAPTTAALSRYRPLLWILAACVAFWTGLAIAWPWWVAGIFAAASGLCLAWAFGAAVSRRLVALLVDRSQADELRREVALERAQEVLQAQQENDDGRT